MIYDYLVVGAGLAGSIFAFEAKKREKKVLVIDKREHTGGNMYCENIHGINVHSYGAHIFHTNNKNVWDYMNNLVRFNRYTNSPIANYEGKLYNLPFNMNTFYQMWGACTPKQAKDIIDSQIKAENIRAPKNLEEKALSMVGRDIYEKLIKGYTEKQWGRKATQLPEFIIKRLPLRFTFDNNYFNDDYQGIPIGGYNKIFDKLLEGTDVRLGVDFFKNKNNLYPIAKKIIFTGPIDQYYDFCYGKLEYRSLRFEQEILDTDNFQGNAVVNYTEFKVPYTRVIEHKHFEGTLSDKTVITREYPDEWTFGKEPYYPVNDEKNNSTYKKYAELAKTDEKIIFAGRLGKYYYYDMHQIAEQSIELADKLL